MFNTNEFNFTVNAVSGTLRKSHPKSKLCIREVDKNNYVFNEVPRLNGTGSEIVVLQTMLTSENKVLIEYVYKREFEERAQDSAKGE